MPKRPELPDWPTKVIRPGGGESLVMGFVRYDDGVAYADDSYLDPMPTTHCIHVVMGKPKEQGDALVVGDHVFLPIEHGEPAATAWRELVGDRDPETLYDATEYDLRKAFVLARIERNVQPVAPGS